MKNIFLRFTIFYAVLLCAGSAFAQNPNDSDECAHLRPWRSYNPQTLLEYPQQYDSLRKYIELCANDPLSFHAFTSTTADVQEYPKGDTTRFDRYRDWLISVLNLNTMDPFYFCGDLEAIMGTYAYGKWKIPNAGIAIMEYLLTNPYCNSEGLRDMYNNSIRSRHDSWKTRHDDGNMTPEDTVLPSLEKLGLDFLPKNDVHGPVSPLPSQHLIAFSASENPFRNETKLRFALNRMAYVTIDIFDELGRPFYGTGTGRTFETGDHELVVDGASLPSGTLYARISTGFGEVKTVKLVHEK
ncbi:MAG: hypothetical protein ABI778_08210 [Ignavibacteriota bacterium]